jgi:lipopolysaccharide/colanic/teichoic acid biosynthesis glycosyltransferase
VARKAELAALLFSDLAALTLAYLTFQAARLDWGGLGASSDLSVYALPSLGVLLGFWLVLFLFAGMYRERHAASRFDEFVILLKVVTLGTLLLFFLLFIERLDPLSARKGILLYWACVVGFVATSRFGVRSVQKALILRGYGLHKAVIVGWSAQVEQLYKEVAHYPAAGLKIVGAVRLQAEPPAELALAGATQAYLYGGDGPSGDGPSGDGSPSISSGDGARVSSIGDGPAFNSDGLSTAVHSIAALPELIDRLGVQDVLIALGTDDHAYLDEVLRVCDGKPVALKLVPDFYTVIGGMARTEHMYGLPLIEVLPEPIPAWERHTKRILDIVVSAVVLTAGLPLWVAVAALVKLTSQGPAIYRQTRTGRHGRPFTMYKFRTMQDDAERHTGPVWAQKGDSRYTPVGPWLRALRIDEVPQLWNVLKGEMSLVGPRPERPFFVEKLVREIPLYSRRHRIQPGITGLAQVKWRYDQDLEDVRQKLKYDLFYIENMSLRMDFQILLQTIRTTLGRQGH